MGDYLLFPISGMIPFNNATDTWEDEGYLAVPGANQHAVERNPNIKAK